ncbi:MAG: PAS domain-containing protein, partial [Limisphaerales bacterium]
MAMVAEKPRPFGKATKGLRGYAIAAGMGGLAVLLHWGLADRVGSHHLPWAAYYIAVMLVEWWIGWRQALVTAGIGLVLGLWVDLPPGSSIHFRDEALWAHVLGYCGVVITIVVLARAAKRRAAELSVVIESMPDAIYIGNRDGITLCNSNALGMLGAKSLSDLN